MKKEYFTIPNLLGYLRILLLPVFLYLYNHADSRRDLIIAFVILGISLLTDAFDGYLARKLNQVTDLGKALDPIADKLTQGFLAIAIGLRYPIVFLVVGFFAAKEIYMGIMGLIIIRKQNYHLAAQWYGKVSTFVVDVILFLLLLNPNFGPKVVVVMTWIMMGVLTISLVGYIICHIRCLKGQFPK